MAGTRAGDKLVLAPEHGTGVEGGMEPMHATIARYAGGAGATDEVMGAGRQLATALSKEPGFVSYALLDVGDGVLVSISVFEQQTELEAADRLVGTWEVEQMAALLTTRLQVFTGEVVVQKGM